MGSLSSLSKGSCDPQKMEQATLWVIWEKISMFEGLKFYPILKLMHFDCP